jgi:hypothetical protein
MVMYIQDNYEVYFDPLGFLRSRVAEPVFYSRGGGATCDHRNADDLPRLEAGVIVSKP